MSARRVVFVFALILLFSTAAFAATARRRGVSAPVVSVTPSGDCFTFGFVRAGLKATYLTTQASGNVNYTITYVFDNATQTKTTQKVTTPQATADAETLLDTEVVGALRATKKVNVKTTTTVPIVGATTGEVDITFVPSLVNGPAQGWCAGATWNVAPSTETITTITPVAQFSSIVTTAASQGAVLAVNESLTVPAGTFSCVKHRGVTVSGSAVSPVISWTSRQHGITVRQDTLDAAGNVTSTTTLQSLQ